MVANLFLKLPENEKPLSEPQPGEIFKVKELTLWRGYVVSGEMVLFETDGSYKGDFVEKGAESKVLILEKKLVPYSHGPAGSRIYIYFKVLFLGTDEILWCNLGSTAC